MGDIAHISGRVLEETEKIIVGKRDKIRLIIMAVLAGGHVLLDDLPGVGKTTLLKTLSIVVGFPFAVIKVLSLASFQKALMSEDTEATDQAYSDSRKKKPNTASQQYE